jgi:hypothetical protein
MNSKDLAIGILSVTATILLVGLILINVWGPGPAYGYAQNASGGDYVVTTSQYDAVTELLYVLDANVEQMNVYGFNVPMGRIELLRSLDVRRRQPPGPERRPAPGRGK